MSVHSRDALIPVPDMSAIIARLQAAEAGSQDLNGAIFRRLADAGQDSRHWFVSTGELMTEDNAPSVTTSLDAALALAERVLPGFTWRVRRHTSGMFDAALWSDPDDNYVGYGRTTSPALALCIATLKAKAQGEGGMTPGKRVGPEITTKETASSPPPQS